MRSRRGRIGLFGLLVSLVKCHAFVAQPKHASSALRSRVKVKCILAATPTRRWDTTATAAADTEESEVFEWLAAEAGIGNKAVSLGLTAGGYRGLLADKDVEQGEVLLEVPSDVCLWSTRDGVVSGLAGQSDLCWEAAGDLRDPVSDEDFARGVTWDVRLALALLEATCDPQIGGKFWSVYGRLLPQPHTVAVPFCLPERLLVQLHNGGMVERARKQVDRMRSLYPDLMQTLRSHPKTAVYVARNTAGGESTTASGTGATEEASQRETDVAPMALLWAFAMVRSRAFAAGGDRFAFVPFLDMANHGFADPAANFMYTSGGEERPGVFQLQAMRNISAGEEVTISYGEQLNAEQLMVQYGFPAPPTVPLERPLCGSDALTRDTPAVASAVTRAEAAVEGREAATLGQVPNTQDKEVVGAGDEEDVSVAPGEGEQGKRRRGRGGWGEEARVGLMNELFLRAQQRFAREASGDERQFEIRVRKVLPLIPPIATKIGELRGDGEEDAIIEGAEAYLKELHTYRSKNFPSTEEQDGELLSFCLGGGRGKVDPRLADVVRYRLGRKEAHTTAAGILEEFLAPGPSAPQAPSVPSAGDVADTPSE